MKNITLVCLALILGCSTYHKRDEHSEEKFIKPVVRGVIALADKIKFLIKSRGVRHLLTATGEVSDEGKKLIEEVTYRVFKEGGDEDIKAFRKLIATEGPVRTQAIDAFSGRNTVHMELLENSMRNFQIKSREKVESGSINSAFAEHRKRRSELSRRLRHDASIRSSHTEKARKILKIEPESFILHEPNEMSRLFVKLLYGSDDGAKYLKEGETVKNIALDFDFNLSNITQYVIELENSKHYIKYIQGKADNLYHIGTWKNDLTGESFVDLSVFYKKHYGAINSSNVSLSKGITPDQLRNGIYKFDENGKYVGIHDK